MNTALPAWLRVQLDAEIDTGGCWGTGEYERCHDASQLPYAGRPGWQPEWSVGER